jgi:hypothetical protein
MSRRHLVTLMIGLLAALTLAMGSQPLTAQDSAFATNTPAGAPLQATAAPSFFATNTPPPPVPLGPDAPVDRYALRRWDEAAMVEALIGQVGKLRSDDLSGAKGIQLLQAELARRFPGAPTNPALRERLLRAMLAAPRGTVDLRPVVRPFIEAVLNRQQPSFELPGALSEAGFEVMVTPANLDNVGGLDAVLMTRYPAGAAGSGLIYVDYTLAVIDAQGVYRMPDTAPSFPAIPFDGREVLTLSYLGDLNGDGLAELAVGTARPGDLNAELAIFGWRGGTAASLVAPGQQVSWLDRITWQPESGSFTAIEVREESADWGCRARREVTWTWSFNFFRPPTQGADFIPENSLACSLAQAESGTPFFAMPVSMAIQTLQQALPLAGDADGYARQRAQMMLAMLYVFNGQAADALDQVETLRREAEPGSWLEGQVRAFQEAAARPDITPLKICAALEAADPAGACDVNATLGRVFTEQPLRQGEPLEAQTARLGLTIIDRLTVTAVGRVPREAVRFDLGEQSWWAFAPIGKESYTAEPIAPPPGYEPRDVPTLRVSVPPAAYLTFFVGDFQATLALLDNAARANSGVPLDSSLRFLRALTTDLLGDRTNARNAYYELWRDDPGSPWGQLAGEHLERR